MYVSRGTLFCIREKDCNIDTRRDNKESELLFLHKNSFILDFRGVGKEEWGREGERGIGK